MPPRRPGSWFLPDPRPRCRRPPRWRPRPAAVGPWPGRFPTRRRSPGSGSPPIDSSASPVSFNSLAHNVFDGGTGGPAAVDGDLGAGDVGGRVGQQESDSARDLLGDPDAPHGGVGVVALTG